MDESGSPISITASQLARHLDWLASGRIRVLPLSEIAADSEGPDAVAITFDDGFANFGELAAPLLAERNIPATVFIVAGLVGGSNAWDSTAGTGGIPGLPLLSWNEIRQLADSGIHFGGHGVTHRSLRGCSASTLSSEIRGCREQIARELSRAVPTFAFPYGHYDAAAVESARSEFSVACTTEFRCLSRADSRHALPRLDMFYFRESRMLERWGTPAFAGYVKLRATGRAVREALTRASTKKSHA